MQFGQLGRREFIVLLGSLAGAWPAAAQPQRGKDMRRVGVLTGAFGPDSQARVAVFLQAMAQRGWMEGQNVHIEIRQGAGDFDAIRKQAAELVALNPDVIMAIGGSATGLLLQVTHTVPIVFTIVPDPVASGFVDSLSRPGGNATGFIQFEYGLSGKWLQLLKEAAPDVKKVAVLREHTPAGVGQFASIQAVAPSMAVEVRPINLHNPKEIERDIDAFAQVGNAGLIVGSSTTALVHRNLIIALAMKNKLPTVYAQREYVAAGGLMSYAAEFSEQFRHAAGYVDRILKGEKAADLPVQAPTKYDLVINLKTANALGLNIPMLLTRADEVIE